MQAVYVTYLMLHVQHLLCLSLKPFLQVLIFLGQKCRLGHTIQVVRLCTGDMIEAASMHMEEASTDWEDLHAFIDRPSAAQIAVVHKSEMLTS